MDWFNWKCRSFKEIRPWYWWKKLALEYLRRIWSSNLQNKEKTAWDFGGITLENHKRKYFINQKTYGLKIDCMAEFQINVIVNCVVSCPMLKTRVEIEFELLYPGNCSSSFNVSEGWLLKFKQRRGIRFLKSCGEILSSYTQDLL